MAGYSGTPLVKKLGIKEGCSLLVINPPEEYADLVNPLPAGVRILQQAAGEVDMIHIFTKKRAELEARLLPLSQTIVQTGMIWVSWPKRSSRVPTDMTEDVIRELALPLGLVDVKVCAVDQTWSGLKLVIRKELRGR